MSRALLSSTGNGQYVVRGLNQSHSFLRAIAHSDVLFLLIVREIVHAQGVIVLNRILFLTRSHLGNLDALSYLFHSCGDSGDDIIHEKYVGLTKLLGEYKLNLNLDEDLGNLCRFCVGLALEISPLLMSRGTMGDEHWKWHPVEIKIKGENHRLSELRPIEKQLAGMVDVLVNQLGRDPYYHNAALALDKYLRINGLWTKDDISQIE